MRSSCTSARTRRCCARAARRSCACSSPRTWRWARACIRWPRARSSISARSCTRSAACRTGSSAPQLVVMGQDVEALIASGMPVESWQEAEAPARRRRWYDSGTGHARRAARERVRRRRPGADARRVPDRVEQDPGSHARRRLARRRALPRRAGRGVRARARRQPRRLGPPARRLGRGLRRADAADRRQATVAADPDARRHAHRLRPPDPPLVGAGRRRARRRGTHRASPVLRQLELPQPREHRHRHRPRARARADRVRRATRRRRHPAPGAGGVPRRREPGLVGELPVLRRAPVLQRPRAGSRGRAPRRRAAEGASPTCAARTPCGCPPR